MKTAILILTGASRGFGRSLALSLTEKLNDCHLHFFLTARHERDLKDTSELIRQKHTERHSNPSLHIDLSVADLTCRDSLSAYVTSLIQKITELAHNQHAHIYLIHNAGSLGELDFTENWSSVEYTERYFMLNVTSVMWINAQFLKAFGCRSIDADKLVHVRSTIVNISSGCGIEPVETFGWYCTGKAAREMHHRVIAKEQEQEVDQRVRVLNYSPGPLDTDMQRRIREEPSVFRATAQKFRCMKEEGTLLSPKVSADRCVEIIVNDDFASGSRVHFYGNVNS